jgi:hypothetical protein
MLYIEEFINTVQKTHFSPLACNRRCDMTLKQNANAVVENIGLCSFLKTKDTKTVQDLVNNVHKRGGNHHNRYSLMTSVPRFFQMRRACEELMVQLVGATVTDNNVAAQIDLLKFIDLFFKRFYLSLDFKKHFDEHGVCKFEVYLDLTNDGTVCGNMTCNVSGLKMYVHPLNGDMSDPDVKNVLLSDRTVCVPLGIFVDKDNFENLHLYNKSVYEQLVEHVGKNGIYELEIDGRKVQFIIKYACSGDLKSHAQAAGLKNLVGVNAANFMFCCTDKQKHSHLLPNARRCRWCIDYSGLIANKKCRHIPYHRRLWKLPKVLEEYQPIMDVIRKHHRKSTTATTTTTNNNNTTATATTQNVESTSTPSIIAESSSNSSSGKRKANDQMTKSSGGLTKKSKKETPSVEQSTSSSFLSPRLHFINWETTRTKRISVNATNDSGNSEQSKTNNDETNGELYKNHCRRLSEYKEEITTLVQADKVLQNYKTPRITLNTFQANSTLTTNTSFACIDDAPIEILQHHIRLRACQDKQQMEEFGGNYKAMNDYVIYLLQHHYNYYVGDHIAKNMDLQQQSIDLLFIIMTVEQYALYFIEESTHTKMLVDDKMKLVICDLHMEMRIGLKLLENLINYGCLYKYTGNFATSLIQKIEYWINTEVFRNKDTGKGTYKFPIEEGKCKPITLTNVSLGKILKNIDKFIDIMKDHQANEQSRHLKVKEGISTDSPLLDLEKFRTVINGFRNVMFTLRQFNESNSDDDYIQWQMETVDPWIDNYINLFGKVDAGYYVHYLARGHVCEQLMYFKNIHRHSQQNWEGLVGRMKKYISSHTQQGGNSSGGKEGGSRKQEPLNIGILRYMLRVALFTLFPNDDDILLLMEEYKDVLNKKNSLEGVTVIEIDGCDDAVDFENTGIVPAAMQDITLAKIIPRNK